ncbi:hypothetical protein NUW58_g1064 [Xylaria curta]|uniref:Uncharacterized protein n=1 Tax=Xylaria curta TaxID=42375 RepID=A0ACC1PNG9_9PEZI|nr:hypothetical protein NUW58_g1064 [Xylaria curta]
MATQGKITTILFDCDNTLVQSEPIGFEVSAEIVNEILALHGIDNTKFTGPQLQREFVGMTFQATMNAIQAKYGLTLDLSLDELDRYAAMEETRVVAKLLGPGQPLLPCVGVNAVLKELSSRGGLYRLAVVSGSGPSRIAASLAAAGQAEFFAEGDIFSAVNMASKPNPAVYKHALKSLGVDAKNCVAIEDSKSGVLAARGAGLLTLGYTGAYELEERPALEKVLVEAGCMTVMSDWAEFLGFLDGL